MTSLKARVFVTASCLLLLAISLSTHFLGLLFRRGGRGEKGGEGKGEGKGGLPEVLSSPLPASAARPLSSKAERKQISGHRYGWFRSELFRVPIEEGSLPLSRLRGQRHVGKTLGTILLIHGFAQNSRNAWDLPGRSFAAYLAEAGYDVFYGDLRGSREASAMAAPIPSGLREYIEVDLGQTLRLIKEISPHKKIYLVGHSMGGALACATAGRFPDDVGGVIHVAGVYGFDQNQNPAWKYFLEGDKFIREYCQFLPRGLVLPTREIGHILRALCFVINSPLLSILFPVTIMVAGSIEMGLLTRYLYESFEPASLGVLQGLTDLSHGQPLCDEQGEDYLKRFEALQLPLCVICADKDDLVSVQDSLRCFDSSTSKDKAKLVYLSSPPDSSGSSGSFGHCDIMIGKHAVVHVWEKIRIWLDQRRKLGLSISQDQLLEHDDSYFLSKDSSQDLLVSSSSSCSVADLAAFSG